MGTNDQLLKVGIAGSIVTAVCCFTPLLPFLLGAIGISWFVGYLDIILLPLLAIFAVITLFAYWKRRSA
ncbi:MAG: mercury resistance system transport protein MerF [Rhizobiaceae bacterium]